LASFISKFTNPIIFFLIFFIILTPLGVILKFLRIDLLKKKINPTRNIKNLCKWIGYYRKANAF
jgi:hypothetical protein